MYWLIALLFLYTGYTLSQINYMNIEWFSRSGCLIVILGGWASFGVVFKEKLLIQRMNWKRNQALNKSKYKFLKAKHHEALSHDEAAEINELHDKELAAQLEHLRLSVGALEASLLIGGTLVWGFGDIFLLYLNSAL